MRMRLLVYSLDTFMFPQSWKLKCPAHLPAGNAVEILTSRTVHFYIPFSCPHAGPSAFALPPPLAVITGTKAPDFLRPEATKQLAKPFHRSRAPLTKTAEPKPVEQPKEWDIASMAPKLKGEGDKRGPPGAVITAAAKRYLCFVLSLT